MVELERRRGRSPGRWQVRAERGSAGERGHVRIGSTVTGDQRAARRYAAELTGDEPAELHVERL